MIRARNEEATLEKCIRSLFALTIPYEIVVVLHLCTDRSKEIVEALQRENDKIHIYEFDVEVSKPGYETLATDVNSEHSFVRYSNWCLRKTTLPWVFRWDADFIANEKLIEFLNEKQWNSEYGQYYMEARNSMSSTRELYLICGMLEHRKYLFWEVPIFLTTGNTPPTAPAPKDVYIDHASELSEVKSFWKRIPWYETEDSDEARTVKSRIERLTADFGPEPPAMARACSTTVEALDRAIISVQPPYVRINE